MPAQQPILTVKSIRKTYHLGRVKVPVLHGVDLTVQHKEWITILGASGSGKSTLMHIIGGLDRPDRYPTDPASIVYGDRVITDLGAAGLNHYRSTEVGFVFQFYHLLPELDILQNICIGSMIRYGRFGYGSHRKGVEARAKDLLDRFGLSDRVKHRPAELSGGERQRVAIARALINEPALLLADEPTGNLDLKTGESILEVLAGLQADSGLTMVMVTHDSRIAARANRTIRLIDGRVAEETADSSV